MNVRTKKKKSPLLLLCVHLSLQPHFLSHTMDLQRLSLICTKQSKREKREEEKVLSSSLCRFLFILSLCVREEDLSLARARAKLLGDRSEIADDDDAVEQYS